jgi:hypothetical protein
LVAFATLAVACIDLSAPKGAASISVLQLPSLFVVRGDVMRDSTGVPAKPRVVAYDGNGNAVPDVEADFFITDSGPAAHFGTDGVLVGDKLGTVRVIGQIGNLQTPVTQIPVTVEPTTIAVGTPPPDTIRAPLRSDSAGSIGRTQISLVVTGAGDTAVQGVLVHLKLTRTLESASSTQPAVYIGDSNGKPHSADSVGYPQDAPKMVIVLTRNLADQALLSGTKVDTVIVEASASYKGAPLKGSPVRLVYPVRVTF